MVLVTGDVKKIQSQVHQFRSNAAVPEEPVVCVVEVDNEESRFARVLVTLPVLKQRAVHLEPVAGKVQDTQSHKSNPQARVEMREDDEQPGSCHPIGHHVQDRAEC
eukprot:CAMPEP_0196579854 /NCGR_PEP_ID=MMETSP1081-20130531/25239_1 /TAXON_ID=36882 /ORGANISM="Pyramimonas amylifera, Strain CCMP720" /LENGTH=105 /DNA_ID=CAMNT_0041899557 /DNA_START=289 /DNA_END=606 /DNA_ORIENTATION=+